MRQLEKTFLFVVAAAWLALGVAEQAEAQSAVITCPAHAPGPGDTFTSEIRFDTGVRALGAYTVAVTYAPSVVVINAVAGGTTVEFAAAPITNPADFASGRTAVSAFNASSLTSPTGAVSVAHVSFRAVGQPGASTRLGLDVITLSDTAGTRLTSQTTSCVVTIRTAAAPTPTPLPNGACTGDCDGNGSVTIDELLALVDIALADADTVPCTAGDVNGDGRITIDEILNAVNNALNDCM